MKTFSVLLALSKGSPPLTGGFPSQSPVTQGFDALFDLRNGWADNRDKGDLRRHCTHYDVTVMTIHYIFNFPEIYISWHPVVEGFDNRTLIAR